MPLLDNLFLIFRGGAHPHYPLLKVKHGYDTDLCCYGSVAVTCITAVSQYKTTIWNQLTHAPPTRRNDVTCP